MWQGWERFFCGGILRRRGFLAPFWGSAWGFSVTWTCFQDLPRREAFKTTAALGSRARAIDQPTTRVHTLCSGAICLRFSGVDNGFGGLLRWRFSPPRAPRVGQGRGARVICASGFFFLSLCGCGCCMAGRRLLLFGGRPRVAQRPRQGRLCKKNKKTLWVLRGRGCVVERAWGNGGGPEMSTSERRWISGFFRRGTPTE